MIDGNFILIATLYTMSKYFEAKFPTVALYVLLFNFPGFLGICDFLNVVGIME